jgi:4-amino-4-deoxy-L-arabinose transferase-like glycosyltransferase
MRFELDHDWQGNMSTPRARVGEKAKTHLLIALCAIWLLMGLVGHSPWKPFESQSVSIIKSIIEGGSWLTPMAVSHHSLQDPPLYYIVAAVFATLLSPVLSLHDAARLSSGIWMLITLLMVGMTGRELWERGVGRQTTFIFVGSLGLVISAHTIMPEISALTGMATAFYALALSKRRPYRAALLLGLGIGISFLSKGFSPLFIILATCLLLPLLFSHWRTKSYALVMMTALIVASPLLLVWPLLCQVYAQEAFNVWWQYSLSDFKSLNHIVFLDTLLWYTWPALPLALWGVWRYKAELLSKPSFQLIIIFFLTALGFIGLGSNANNIYALPLLIPLTAMAGGSIETLKRGAAGALNWFGLILFGILSSLIWLGWGAMMTGQPAKIKERLIFLSGLTKLDFSLFAFVFAMAITLVGLFSILRSKHSNRSAATNWAVGMTCVWTLLMTLWLPMIDSARSYQPIFSSLKQALPKQYACIASNHLGSAQQDLLYYFASIKTLPFETEQQLNCEFYLIQDDKNRDKIELGSDWKLIWSGKRISERKESFRLFQQAAD